MEHFWINNTSIFFKKISMYIFILMLENFNLISTYKFVYFIICRFIPKREIDLNIKG